jgi:hypothetical protein
MGLALQRGEAGLKKIIPYCFVTCYFWSRWSTNKVVRNLFIFKSQPLIIDLTV